MGTLLHDLKQSFRSLRGSLGFTITAVAALAIGIGANTAIFSVISAVLLRPLPYPDPDRVVVLLQTFESGSGRGMSPSKFNLWRERASMLQDIAGYRYSAMNLSGSDHAEQVQVGQVTAAYFRLFGLPVAKGRAFTADEDRPEGKRVAVLSDTLWTRLFGADPNILGKTISLRGNSYEVIGVVAAGFKTEVDPPADVYLPFQVDPHSADHSEYFTAAARLRPGVTLNMVRAQLQLVVNEFRRIYPGSGIVGPKDGFSVQPMWEALVSNVRSSLLVLAGAVGFVLLIACANVASLLLVRATGRRREIAIRVAVGAGRGRIIRQLLTESVVLSAVGGILGLFLGSVGIRALLAMNTGDIPRIGAHASYVAMDWRVLVFTAIVSLTTGILFGLVPAFQASRADLSVTLKESGGCSGSGMRHNKVRSLLVVSEMTLALVLLIGAGLLIRTFIALRSVNPGFESHHLLTMRMSLSDARFEKTSAVAQLVHDGVERIRALPGVVSVGAACCVPVEGAYALRFIIVGRPLNGPSHGGGGWLNVSSGYFDALKIPILRGRAFLDSDRLGAAPVVIINQTMALKYWSKGDPLNDRLIIGRGLGPEFEEAPRQIIGVVGDVHNRGLVSDPLPTMYVPTAQLNDGVTALLTRVEPIAWMIRTRGEPLSSSAAIQQELRQASGGLPVASIRSMDEVVSRSMAREDFTMLVLTAFASSALLLAAIGIYGLMAYSVEQRRQEIGIRMALGAETAKVRNMVVAQGMALALMGVAIGIAAAFGLTRILASFLFRVTTWDPATFVVVPLLLSAVALFAVWFPARRATRIDPIDALRYE
jgi:putative ABC transport system permease protein